MTAVKVVRLALGVEVRDAVRGDPADVRVWWENGRGTPWLPRGSQVGRFRLVYREAVTPTTPARLRVLHTRRRFVPRRFELAFPTLAQLLAEEEAGTRPASRAVSVGVWPGATFRVEAGSTGSRGRVLDAATGNPVRWCRAEATHPDSGERLGYAHGDDRGEFLLLLGTPPNALAAPAGLGFDVRVTVAAPPGPRLPAGADPLADLVLETRGGPGTDTPPGYTATASRVIRYTVGQVVSSVDPFVLS